MYAAISWSKYCPLACAKITFCASSYWAAPGTQKIDPLVVLRCRSSSPDLFHLVWSWSFLSIFSQELRPLAPSLGKVRWTNILKDQFRLKHQNYWTKWSTPSTSVINLWSPAIRRLVNCAQGFFQFATLLAKDSEIYARSKCFQKSGISPVPKSTKATYRLWSVKPPAFLQNPPAEPAAYLLAAASVLSRRGWAEHKAFYSMETFSEHIFSMPSFKHLLFSCYSAENLTNRRVQQHQAAVAEQLSLPADKSPSVRAMVPCPGMTAIRKLRQSLRKVSTLKKGYV